MLECRRGHQQSSQLLYLHLHLDLGSHGPAQVMRRNPQARLPKGFPDVRGLSDRLAVLAGGKHLPPYELTIDVTQWHPGKFMDVIESNVSADASSAKAA